MMTVVGELILQGWGLPNTYPAFKSTARYERAYIMFWNKRPRQDKTSIRNLDAAEIVSQVGGIFADLNDQGLLVKPRSSLPCSWFAARECFMIAYEEEYTILTQSIKDSFHQVYGELAFFVDDGLCKDFNDSLNIVANSIFEEYRSKGFTQDVTFYKNLIASCTVKIETREEIWTSLARYESCPTRHLLLLFETLTYCGQLHRSMFDEWAAFANLTAYQNKSGES